MDELADRAIIRVGARVEHGGEHLAWMAVRGEKPLGIGAVDRNRFFHQHVETGFERGHTDGGVRVVGRSDEHRVDWR